MYRGSHQYNSRGVVERIPLTDDREYRAAAKAGRFTCVENEVRPMPAQKVLIVDDERLVRWSLRQKCEEWGYAVVEADAGETALRLAECECPDLVLLDVRLSDLTGIEVLDQLKKNGCGSSVIMITADPQLDDVKASLKLGAYDFVGKPIDFDQLQLSMQDALEAATLRNDIESPRAKTRGASYENIVSVSPKMTELMHFVKKVASCEASTILIQGESGTGKDLIAKTIHYESSRHEKPFVAINCSAIPETLMEAELFGHEKGAFTDAKQMKKGLFEAADGGTLFLDEIGELSPLLQAKLLRVLEDQVIRRVGGIRDMQVDVAWPDLLPGERGDAIGGQLRYQVGVRAVGPHDPELRLTVHDLREGDVGAVG